MVVINQKNNLSDCSDHMKTLFSASPVIILIIAIMIADIEIVPQYLSNHDHYDHWNPFNLSKYDFNMITGHKIHKKYQINRKYTVIIFVWC